MSLGPEGTNASESCTVQIRGSESELFYIWNLAGCLQFLSALESCSVNQITALKENLCPVNMGIYRKWSYDWQVLLLGDIYFLH